MAYTERAALAAPVNGDGAYAWQNPLPNGTHSLNGISCSSTTFCVAVGDGIAATVDGTAWTSRVHSEANVLNGVGCPDSNHCYAVGGGGTILATTNAAETWSGQTSGITSSLNSVSCPSASTCYAVGDAAEILSTTNSGSTWASTLVTSTNLSSVSCPGSTTCWAIGSTSGTAVSVYKTTDGSTWQVQSSVTTNAPTGFLNPGTTAGIAISCPTTSSCAAVSGAIVMQTTDGTNWSTLSGPSPTFVTCTAGSSQCLASSSTQLRTFTLGGSAGTAFTVPAGFQPQQATCPSTSSCFLTEASGATMTATITSGNVASVASSSVVNTGGWTGIACPAVGTCYASEATGIGKTTKPQVSWSLLPSVANLGGNAIACPSISVCYDVGNAGYIWYTSNGGANWTQQASGLTTANLLSIACASVTNCVATGSGGAIAYTSNASTWALATSFNGTSSIPSVSCPAGSTVCFAVSGVFLGYAASAFSSPSWSQLNTLNTGSNAMNGISCPSAGFCAAVGTSGTIRVSSSPAGAGNWTTPTSSGTSQQLMPSPVQAPRRAMRSATQARRWTSRRTHPAAGRRGLPVSPTT